MSGTRCVRCRLIRTVLLSVLLGGGGGFAVLALGGPQDLSMIVTFCGAIAPVLWLNRAKPARKDGSE
jgi:hypothetical protein